MPPEHLIIVEYIKAIGFPICAAIALAWALVKIFRMYVDAVDDRNKLATEHAMQLATISEKTSSALEKNTEAMAARSGALERNTVATDELSGIILQLGKEPGKICRYQGPAGAGLIFLFLLLTAANAAAGPADAVLRMPSHGGSGTVIATGEGWTLILSCAHCFEGYRMIEDPRTGKLRPDPARPMRMEPITLQLPYPVLFGDDVKNEFGVSIKKRKVGVKVLAVNHAADLSLIQLNYGPVPYIAPVAPPGFKPGPCLSSGFDEMIMPAQCRPARIVGAEPDRTLTDSRPWHGRSGGALIDKKSGYLVGVVSAYEGEPLADKERFPRGTPFEARLAKHENGHGYGVYSSLEAINRFLVKEGVRNGAEIPLDRSRPPPGGQSQPRPFLFPPRT